jgi:hypothetical protein
MTAGRGVVLVAWLLVAISALLLLASVSGAGTGLFGTGAMDVVDRRGHGGGRRVGRGARSLRPAPVGPHGPGA